jgi:hypothetical protein
VIKGFDGIGISTNPTKFLPPIVSLQPQYTNMVWSEAFKMLMLNDLTHIYHTTVTFHTEAREKFQKFVDSVEWPVFKDYWTAFYCFDEFSTPETEPDFKEYHRFAPRREIIFAFRQLVDYTMFRMIHEE